MLPRTRARVTAALSIAICLGVELFQLTGIPARGPRLARVALGDTFAWHDVACYLVGGVLVALVVEAHARVTGPKKANG